MYEDPEVSRYLYSEPLDGTSGFTTLAKKIGIPAFDADGQAMSLAGVLRETGELIGDFFFLYSSQVHRSVEIGYVLRPDVHGQGFALEASEVLLGLGFDGVGAHRVYARCDARNTASAAVMAKLGMRKEAHFIENEWVKGEWTDELVYAILEPEWRERRASVQRR